MGGLVAAWAVGEGIIIFRSVKTAHAPPLPGQLIASSALFVMLALLAESDTARPLATTLAWGFNLAALLNAWPSVTGGAPAAASKTASPTSKGAAPTATGA